MEEALMVSYLRLALGSDAFDAMERVHEKEARDLKD